MIQSKTALKNNKVKHYALICAALSVIFMYTAPFVKVYAPLLQVLSLCAITAGLYLITRHLLYDYLYTIDNGAFRIHKVTKRKSLCVTDVDLKDLSKPMSKEEYDRKKDDYATPVKTFCFYKNIKSKDLTYILWTEDVSPILIIFEPDEQFRIILEEQIEKYKEETEEYND